jgi:hypothetical protein
VALWGLKKQTVMMYSSWDMAFGARKNKIGVRKFTNTHRPLGPIYFKPHIGIWPLEPEKTICYLITLLHVLYHELVKDAIHMLKLVSLLATKLVTLVL